MLHIKPTDEVSIKRLPNTEGFDSHSFRAYAYFKDNMPDVTEELSKCTSEAAKVSVINSIQTKYKDWRTKSKAPTFALT